MGPAQDLHVLEMFPLIAPNELKREIPISDAAGQTVSEARAAIAKMLRGEDKRLLIIVGPCSIHDTKAALEYAERLSPLARKMKDRLYIVMRTYFEKPRTTVGWRGLINDPHLDDSFDMVEGIRIARQLLEDINSMGLPTATEMLDPVIPQYIAELVCCTVIGARTTESQTHRALASGLSMPVGFKNSTDGSLQVAMDAMVSAQSRHSFFGIDMDGRSCVVKTTGNPDGMIILRGGRTSPNYYSENILAASKKLEMAGQISTLMVDCSHANSGYDPAQQKEVWKTLIQERPQTRKALIGLMAESFLHEGKQPIKSNLSELQYGVSVTDACMSWETTEELLHYTYEMEQQIDQAG